MTEATTLTGADLIQTLDKDGLEAYARQHFQRELDKRKKHSTLVDEVLALHHGTTQAKEKVAAAAEVAAERRANAQPKRVRHKLFPERVYPWNPQFKGNTSLEVIEWKE
jgi:hypothetical protein